ncbi:hypothetical protein HMPREF3291_16295 [Bacillus sp. HMSC76G11]|nr:hypothetical protein HMPREF3291_16295 [Bacillus sp. HMSC76G11]
MGFYDPPFVSIFLLLLGLIYIPVAIYTISRFKLNVIGYLLAAASFASYLLVGAYMAGSGYYADEHATRLFGQFGFLELILLSYAYIFIGLSVVLGKKGELQ